jgi:hypothetical protein
MKYVFRMNALAAACLIAMRGREDELANVML